jgi:H+/Cl- antiporter ClcA
MDYAWIVPLLALVTLLAVALFALVSKERTEARRHDPNAPKSTLAKDGPQGGVSSLNPTGPRPEDKPHVRPVLE